MDWFIGSIALINAIAAVTAWIAKIKWSREYRDATNQIIAAKDAQISAQEDHLEIMHNLNPKTIQEWYIGLKELSETYVNRLRDQLNDAQQRIKQLESIRTEKDQDLDRMRTAYDELSANHAKLIEELETKQIPDPETLAGSVLSAKALADLTNSESPGIEWLNVDDWDAFLRKFRIQRRS